MWSYSKQIKLRYASFVLAIILLLLAAFLQSRHNPEFLSRIGLRSFLTTLSISTEFQPLQTFALFFSSSLLLMLFGIPSIIFFISALILRGFAPAFIFVLIFQTVASWISINLAKRSFARGKRPAQLEPDLRKLSSTPQSFALWSRIYYSFPLRSIDSITPGTIPPDMPTRKIIPSIAAAIAVRLLIPSLWANSLLNLLTSTGHNYQHEVNALLMWSSALIVYTIIPKIPEVFICPENIKKVLYKLEIAKDASPEPVRTQETESVQSPKQQGQKRSRTVGGRPQLAK